MMSVWRYPITVLLLTALCSDVAEAKLIAGDCPTFLELRHFPVKDGFKDIVGEIANDYQSFGIPLLNDEMGTRIRSIERTQQNPVDITVDILRQWLLGSGRLPVTWQILVECLKEAKLHTAAEYIEDKLLLKGLELPPTTSPPNPSTAVAERNIAMIKGSFATLVTTSCSKLQYRAISVDHVKKYLITMYSSPHTMDGINTINRVLGSVSSLDEIFLKLTEYGLWNYHNYYLLQNIIYKFAHDDIELKGMMQQYQSDLTGHILALKIPTYLDAINIEENIIPTISHKLFKKLQVKVNGVNITDHSVNYVIDLWQSLTHQFVLPKPALILHSIAEGCINITWLVPANLVKHITKMVQDNSSMFAKLQILKVMLEEQCIYPVNAECEPPLPEYEPIKQKECTEEIRCLEIPSLTVAGMEPMVVALVVGILVILLVMVVVKSHRGSTTENQHESPVKKQLQTPHHVAVKEGHDNTAWLVMKRDGINTKEENGMTPLHRAAESGRIEVVEILIDQVADINSRDDNGSTPLHIAASKGRDYTVERLVEKGADINIKDKAGTTPLHLAAEGARIKILGYLVEQGADINIQNDKGQTPLHVAASKGRDYIVECLVKKGADINIKDKAGMTPLHFIAKLGLIKVLDYLVKQGADINIQDDNGQTPLHVAASKSRDYTVECLVEKGADVNIKDKAGMTPLHLAAKIAHIRILDYLVKQGADINIQDDNGRTPVHVAASKGHGHTVECLVKKGADIRIQDKAGMTPLHLAAEDARIKVLGYLVKQGADINIQDHNGRTPVHVAASKGHDYTVECLVEKGADINIKDKAGMTPLHLAAKIAHIRILGYLVKQGADINIQNHNGRTPVHVAASKGHGHTVECLVKKGADIRIQDKAGMTPLHLAAKTARIKILDYLVKQGADINIQDHNGRTPVHVAASKGRDYTVECLVKKGANINIIDKAGMTPLHLAAEGARIKVLDYLVKQGADINIQDHNGSTPLHVAASKGRDYTVECLAEKEANISIKDKAGMTPLHLAAKSGRIKILKYLIYKGSNINTQDDNGRTPLHVAAGEDHDYTVQCLVQKGAAINIKDKSGRTPMEEAAVKGHMGIVHYLNGDGISETDKDCGTTNLQRGQNAEKNTVIQSGESEVQTESKLNDNEPAGSGKEKEKPRKIVETVSEQVQGVAERQGSSGSDTLPEQMKLKIKSLEADNEKLTSQLDQNKSSYNSFLGVEVVGGVDLVVTKETMNFQWKDHGFKLHVPENALPEGITEYSVNIKVSLTGQFEIPEGYELVSAVYWMKTPGKFTKPVAIEVQHCANLSTTNQLCFVRTSCAQKSLPYKYKVVNGGSFVFDKKYGVLSTTHFSGIGIAKEVKPNEHSCQYCAQVYYTDKSLKDYLYYCHFVVTKDLEMCLTMAKRKYQQEYDIAPPVTFDGDRVALDIPDDGTKTDNGWDIVPVHVAHIKKERVDSFSSENTWVPECVLLLEWKQKDKAPETLNHKMKLKGTGEERDFFQIVYNPGAVSTPQRGPAYSTSPTSTHDILGESDLLDITTYLDVMEKSHIYHLGLVLGIRQTKLNALKDSVTFLDDVISAWLRKEDQVTEKGDPSWTVLVNALKHTRVGQLGISNEIAKDKGVKIQSGGSAVQTERKLDDHHESGHNWKHLGALFIILLLLLVFGMWWILDSESISTLWHMSEHGGNLNRVPSEEL